MMGIQVSLGVEYCGTKDTVIILISDSTKVNTTV
jgi:hypothetical protein